MMIKNSEHDRKVTLVLIGRIKAGAMMDVYTDMFRDKALASFSSIGRKAPAGSGESIMNPDIRKVYINFCINLVPNYTILYRNMPFAKFKNA